MESSEPPSASFYLVLLVILLVFSMCFSAAETAFLSASRLRMRYLKEKNNKSAARVERLLSRKVFFLNAILIGNNVVNIATSSLITALALHLFGDAGVGIATAFATIIILIFGEILPKSVALQRPESIALKFSLPLSIFIVLISPVVLAFSFITRFLSGLFAKKNNTGNTVTTVTEEDIKTLIEVGEEEGVIEPKERDMMHKILKYTDLTARDIMTPRTAIATIAISASRAEILDFAHESRFSRFPVYGDDIDDIRGILYVKDFLFSSGGSTENFSVKAMLRPALFVFENQKISDLQEKLRVSRQNIAIVVDEYGGTAGIVTTEDLVEEIFGGIRDEYDRPERAANIEAVKDAPIVIAGTERLDELGDRLGIRLESTFYDTIAGYIMERSGEIPQAGFHIEEQGFGFTVLALSGNRIESVRVEKETRQ
jgi:CBS domain containing-hemolysin-like protein